MSTNLGLISEDWSLRWALGLGSSSLREDEDGKEGGGLFILGLVEDGGGGGRWGRTGRDGFGGTWGGIRWGEDNEGNDGNCSEVVRLGLGRVEEGKGKLVDGDEEVKGASMAWGFARGFGARS